jgi:hypothetical protein
MYQVDVIIGPKFRRTVAELKELPREVYKNIRVGFKEIGEMVQERIRNSMSHTVHAPWFYSKGGQRYSPSRPHFPPAVQEGILYRAIEERVSGTYPEAQVRIGPDASPEVYYAKYLEEGTSKMIERPYQHPAFVQTKDAIIQTIHRKINQSVIRVAQGR